MANNINKKSNEVVVENNTKKVVTKYDKKVLERKQHEAQEIRNKKIFKISSIVVVIAIIIGVTSFFVVRHNNMYGEYITVGDNEITKIEYDYYYNNIVNNFASANSSYISYLGLDANKSYVEQESSLDNNFSQSAVDLIKQTKALVSEAKAKDFKYDVTSDYNSFTDSIKQAADAKSQSLKEYYKTKFGIYATQSNLESIIKEYLTFTAYYSQLAEQNTPSDSEITSYYQANKDKYDSYDYRLLSVSTEAAANEMLAKVQDETTFATLCKTYASDTEKSKYESADASLVKGLVNSSAVYSSWLYDSSRKTGDKTVVADSNNGVYYVIYFVNRSFDDATNKTISNTISADAVSKYVKTLTDTYTVTDKHNHLKYLSEATEAETVSK